MTFDLRERETLWTDASKVCKTAQLALGVHLQLQCQLYLTRKSTLMGPGKTGGHHDPPQLGYQHGRGGGPPGQPQAARARPQ